MAEEKFCENHGVMCNNVTNLKKEIDDVKESLDKFKQYTYGKFDNFSDNYNALKEMFIRMEVKFEEKFAHLEKLLLEKKTNWGLFIGQFLYPLFVALVLYLILK